MAVDAVAALDADRREDARDELTGLADHLRDLLLHYQAVLTAADADLPYVKPIADDGRAARLLHENLYGILRIDDPTISEHAVTLKEVVHSSEAAAAEVERLSSLKAAGTSRYMVQVARVVPAALRPPTKHSR
jgi:hypothetical protein